LLIKPSNIHFMFGHRPFLVMAQAVVQAQSPQLAAWEVLPLTPKQLEHLGA
jgi:hypothetical protein